MENLAKGFVLAKPIAKEGYDPSILDELELDGDLIITRKRDGWKLYVMVTDSENIKIYTAGVNEVDNRLDHIKDELASLELAPNTLIIGEAIIDEGGNDQYTKTTSFFHSDNATAMAMQKKEKDKVRLMIFGFLDIDGEEQPLWLADFDALADCIQEYRPKLKYIFMAPILKCTLAEAKAVVVDKGWEGLVLYDKSYRLEYRLDGKNTRRPKGCYKWKPILEDDFVVRKKVMRPNSEVLKDLVIYQIDPTTGKEFECGKLGTFSNQLRENFTKKKLPFVVQAEFEARFPRTGKIRNARFVRVRTDKKVGECIAPESYA